MLTVKGVSKIFDTPDNGTESVRALEDVSLDVKEGEFFSVIGPSGCGKSTLIRIIAGLIPSYDGEVRIGPERVNSPHPWVGMVFQEESTFPWRTTVGNVEFGLEMRDVPPAARRTKALEMLDLVGLGGFE
jgi:NitT/TauT family transport system ATP-binding protein